MYTLDTSNDTSIPACCCIPVLRFAMWGAESTSHPVSIIPGDSYLMARSERDPLRHLMQMLLSIQITAAQMPGRQSPPSLIVALSRSISFSGPPGGPFSPSVIECRLSASTGTISYSIRTPARLTASSTFGAADRSGVTITLSVNASVSSLSPGAYGPAVAFTNVGNGRGSATKPARLVVRGSSLPRSTGQIERGQVGYCLMATEDICWTTAGGRLLAQ